jgi:hypothetical protein
VNHLGNCIGVSYAVSDRVLWSENASPWKHQIIDIKIEWDCYGLVFKRGAFVSFASTSNGPSSNAQCYMTVIG